MADIKNDVESSSKVPPDPSISDLNLFIDELRKKNGSLKIKTTRRIELLRCI